MPANTVSIQRAAEKALADWLQSQIPDAKVSSKWIEAGVPIPQEGAISVIRAGALIENSIVPPNVQKRVDDPPPAVTSLFYFRTHWCEQPLQLDVWATSEARRDDLVNRLGDALTAGPKYTLPDSYFASEGITTNQNPVAQQIVLLLEPPWDHLIGAYGFDAPETEDSAAPNKRREYRAMYRGAAYFDRTVMRRLPRLTKISARIVASALDRTPASDEKAPTLIVTPAGASITPT